MKISSACSGVGHRPGAVGGGEDDRLSAHSLRRVFVRRIAQLEAFDGQPFALAAQQDLIGGELLGQGQGIGEFQAGDNLLAPAAKA